MHFAHFYGRVAAEVEFSPISLVVNSVELVRLSAQLLGLFLRLIRHLGGRPFLLNRRGQFCKSLSLQALSSLRLRLGLSFSVFAHFYGCVAAGVSFSVYIVRTFTSPLTTVVPYNN